MKFDDLDARMRVYEQSGDVSIIPGLYAVVRIDGRSFTRLTREKMRCEAPFDSGFHEAMVATAAHCMGAGFKAVIGYTHSDEISILLDQSDSTFQRKTRKIVTVLAGEASGFFSVRVGVPAAFDARVCPLPDLGAVIDYFRWRNEDANRNALNSYCYWTLRKTGLSSSAATNKLLSMSVAQKNELLFEHGINYGHVPKWQKRGTALCYREFKKPGTNRLTGEPVYGLRRRLEPDGDLPMGRAFEDWIRARISETRSGAPPKV